MDKDITYYHKEIQKYIERVEEDKKDKEAIEKVEELFRIMYEHIKLFLIENRERYYGYILMNLNVEISCYFTLIAAVSIEELPFLLRINPLILGKYEIKEIIYILCHEIEHIVLNHPSEMVRLNPSNSEIESKLLNIAMDASVNDRLDYDIKKYKLGIMKKPDKSISSRTVSFMAYKEVEELKSFYEYYSVLKNAVKEMDDEADKNEILSLFIVNSGGKGQDPVTEKDLDGKNVIVEGKLDSSEQCNELTKQFIKEIWDSIPEDAKDNMPSYQIEAINKLFEKPKISWKGIFKKYVGLVPNSYRNTKMRLNRRQPERFDVPGKVSDKTVRVVVAIDTSGSLSRRQLSEIFNEIFGMLKRIKSEITIIECDCDIQKVYTVKNKNDLQYSIKGRGGTAFRPVIEYINDNPKYRNCILIYFTDGFGENSIPKPKTYRNIWVIYGEKKNLSLIDSYGDVIEL